MVQGRKLDAFTGVLARDTKHLIETNRGLVEISQREAAEARVHIAQSTELIVESRKLLKRPRDN
jgi:hypothetical protein